MISLIVIPVVLGYVFACIAVVRFAKRWARENGRSVKRWGWGAALAVTLPVFWDFIPTVLLYQYLCATEQGVWIYKTVEQWQQENPGVAETLTWSKVSPNYYAPGIRFGMVLNQRFVWEQEIRHPVALLPVRVTETRIMDRGRRETVAKLVTIGAGYGNPLVAQDGSWKIWLSMPSCMEGYDEFSAYQTQVKRQGELK